MTTRIVLFLGLLLIAGSLRILAVPTAQPGGHQPASAAADNAADVKEGEKRFQENCGRCHHPPDSISPREAKAVLRQMRVRAMLSVEDERLILKFLAP